MLGFLVMNSKVKVATQKKIVLKIHNVFDVAIGIG